MNLCTRVALGAISLAISTGVTTAAFAGPDLTIDLSELSSGKIIVTNIGDAEAGKSVATITCENLTGAGGCGDPPANFEAHFTDPAYPNAAVVSVRKLRAGASAQINLPFWNVTTFAAGENLQFSASADAGNDVAEDDETNNDDVTTLSF
jgi:hypothetical protein